MTNEELVELLKPFLERQAELEAKIARLERGAATTKLQDSSLQGSSLNLYDANGELTGTIGVQPDGSVGTVHVAGPVPPKPTPPTVTTAQLGLTVNWDGRCIDEDGDEVVVPTDFQRVDIYISETPAFALEDGLNVASLTDPSDFPLSPLAEVPYYVRLVTVTKAGVESEPSDAVGPYTPDAVVASDLLDGIVDTLKLADDAVTQAKMAAGSVGNNELINAAVDAAKIANDAVTNAAIASGAVDPDALSTSLNQTVMQRFTDGFEDSQAWTVVFTDTGTSWSLVDEPTAPSGGKVGQANGYIVIKATNAILYDPNTLYRLSARIRCKTEAGTGVSSVYVGLLGLDNDRVTPINRSGVSGSFTSHSYIAASNSSLPASSGWVTYTGYAKGRASTGTAGTNTDIQSPGAMQDGVRYVTPYIWLNYANHDPASIIQIDSVTFEPLRTGVVTAAEIAANAVTATKIVAGAITSDKMSIGATGNMLSDPSFEGAFTANLVSGNTYWSVDSTKGNGSSKSLKVDATAGSATTRTIKPMTIPWQAGEQLYLSYVYQTSSGFVGTPKFYATWKDSSGTTLGWGVAQPSTVVVGGSTWNSVSGVFTAPANTVSADISFEVFNGTAGQLWFDTAVCRPVWSGTSIADGAITTVKLAALSVTANELAANAVTAAKILAGEIGATHLAAGAVTAGKIAAGAIQAGNIAAGAIQTNDIAANAITGAKIAGLTITGDKIAANQITAGHLVAGTITADKLDVNALVGKTAQSTNFVNDPEQGITGWQLNADGSVYIRNATIGNNLYEINETGNAKFQTISVSDIFVDGEDFEALVDNLPIGILNVYPLSGTYTYPAANTEYFITRFTIPNVESRMYRITLDNFRFDRGDNTGGQTAPTQFQVNVYSDYDGTATNADYNLHSFWRGSGYTQSASDDLWTASHTFSPSDADLGKDLSIAVYSSVNGINTGPALQMTSNSRILVEDVGGKVVYAPTVDITNPVAAKTTYTKTYSSTWMSTWGVNSGRRTDGNAYQGNYSSTNGNNYTKYGFSSSIQTDLSGATVKKVEVYLDNNHFYSNSGGNAIIGTHANSTQPTGSSSTTGTFGRQSTAFTKGQAKWVTLSSAFGTDLKSGAALGITLGRTSGGTLAEYGYFSSSAKLRITYEK